MLKRALLLVAVGLMMVALAAVQADSLDGVICGELSEADCQILLTNAEVMDGVYALRFDMSLLMSIRGAGLDEDFEMSGTAGGSFAVDPAAADALAPALEAAEGDAATWLEMLLAAVRGDVSLNLSGSSGEEAIEMELNLLLKDGVIVFGAGAMEDLTGQPMEGVEWFGVDTSGAIGDLLSAGSMGTVMDMDKTSALAMDEAEAGAITVARLPDEIMGGIPVAVFESSIDVKAILQLLTIEAIQAASPDQSADADMALALAQSIDVREMSSRQYIGLDDHYTHRLTMSVDLTVQGGLIGADYGDANLTMNIDINLSEFNRPLNVEIPEDAFVFPLAMWMQMGSQ